MMINKLSGWLDTIVAIATPPGVGAIAVIRVSGSESLAILNAVFPSKNLFIQPSHTIHYGFIKDGTILIDEVLLSIFKNPTSYTGEDIVEISCHGSPLIQQQLINLLISKGCRLAKAGEFTQRAFLNGKLDLTQAEAVADLIASNSDASKTTALKNIRGGFKSDVAYLRDSLIRFSALIELELDFATEDVEFVDRSSLKALLDNLITINQQLLHSFKLGNVIKNGVQVAIIGKPNAGKSTLLNALLNEDRAIVSEIAGTTRDTIEEVLNINGVLFRLIDTAGIRSHSIDSIENLGIKRSLDKMRDADIVIYLFDINDMLPDDVELIAKDLAKQSIKYVLVANKADTLDATQIAQFDVLHPLLVISANKLKGIEQLKQTLYTMVIEGDINTEATIVTNVRHYDALLQLSTSLEDVTNGLNNNISGDLLSLDIRQCLHYLGLITGEVTNEDQLDFIFSKFCIGK